MCLILYVTLFEGGSKCFRTDIQSPRQKENAARDISVTYGVINVTVSVRVCVEIMGDFIEKAIKVLFL